MHLLLVDDEKLILQGLLHIVQEMNTPFIDISTAVSAQQALECMRSHHVDFMLTDISMPIISGLDLIAIAKEEGLCDRFALLSGYQDFDYARTAIRNQAMDYLLKPVDKKELYALLLRASDTVHIEGNQATNKSSSENIYIQNILEIIHQRASQNLTLELVSEEIGLHPNYVSKLFKKEIGLTFVKYLNNYRIKQAQQCLLKYQHWTMEQVADEMGYTDIRLFYKAFKRESGQTPSQFKANSTNTYK